MATIQMKEKSKAVEQWLDSHSATWEWVPSFPIEDIDLEEGLHNQARMMEPLHEPTVTTYLEALERGDAFPAVILARRGEQYLSVPVDGNHRLAAAVKLGAKTVGAYVVKGDPGSTRIIALTMGANSRHGSPVPLEQRLEQAVWMVANGISQAKAASELNVPASRLKARLAKERAAERGPAAGVKASVWNGLSLAIRQKLAQITTDEGLRAAANLAAQAQLNGTEVNALVAHVNESRSAAKQVAAVKAFGAQFEERAEATGGGMLTGKATPKQRFTLALSNLMSLPDNLGAALSKAYAAPERKDAAKQARAAAAKLNKLADTLDGK